MSSRACISTFGQPCQEDRCRRAANALVGLILLRYGEGERTFSPTLRRPATMRMPVLVRRPATGPSTSPPDASRRSPRRGLLADSPRPGRTATEQAPQPALQHRPGHQPVLVGYGDDHRRSLPAVVAFQHPVREAPRVFVPDERYAVRPRRLPGPLEQQRGTRRGIYA
jgi:hypothetical protein